jgi:hypothetical protein
MNVKELAEKLTKYPDLKQRMEELLAIVENSGQEIMLADIAEERVIDAMRGMGRELMQNWSDNRSKQTSLQMKKSMPSAKKNIKKKSTGKPPSVK